MNPLFAVLAVLTVLAACETTEGIGRDVGKLGNNIENAAEKSDTNTTDDPRRTGY